MNVVAVTTVICMLSLVVTAVPVRASHFDGMEAYRQNDFKTAMREFKACEDDVKCMYMLGIIYEKGEGIKSDYFEAAQWFRKASEKDDPVSQYRLGRLYERGLGVEENQTEAMRLYKKSAQKGNPNAKQALKRLESK